jgi:hypothetical protein
MVRKVDEWTAAIIRGHLEWMGDMAKVNVRPTYSPLRTFPTFTDSLRKTQRTIRTRMHILALEKLCLTTRVGWGRLWRMVGESHGVRNRLLSAVGRVFIMCVLYKFVMLMFNDSHPCVRYAGQCVSALVYLRHSLRWLFEAIEGSSVRITDFEVRHQPLPWPTGGVESDWWYSLRKLFAVLIPTLKAPEPRCVIPSCTRVLTLSWPTLHCMFRVHFDAAAVHVNFYDGVEWDTLVPYLDPIFECLLKILHPTGDYAKQAKCYIQEQPLQHCLWSPMQVGLLPPR